MSFEVDVGGNGGNLGPSGNPTFTDLTLTGDYRQILTSDTSWSTTFSGSIPLVSAVHDGTANSAILGYYFNDQPNDTDSLPAGIIGYGKLDTTKTGNQVFGIYGLAENGTAAGVAVGGEITVRNTGGAPDTALPPDESIGTSTIVSNGLQITSGGTHDSSVGLQISREGGSTVNFNTGQYIHDFTQYGLYIDDDRSATGAALQVNGTGRLNNSVVTTGTGGNLSGLTWAQLDSKFNLAATAGGAFGWNYSGGGGEVDLLINKDGGAVGGLNLYDFPGSSGALTLIGELTSDGWMVGDPTGNRKGAGTLNVVGTIYQNNVAIATGKAATQAQPSNPTAPDSTSTYKMQGLAGTITPALSGNVLIIISGSTKAATTTAGDGILFQISYGTGAAPSSLGALAGTQVGPIIQDDNNQTSVIADAYTPFSVSAIVTGLTPATAYWIDLAAKSVATNSSMGLVNIGISAVEI